ncbi:polysaccharide lyase family 7 protein [Vibrio hyugaensis]|uniref:polysaccharide lyase family 7 protein n=1 Tax=Vibrio hyugaensis TaxID=1534743 RepID=UPI0006933045|nr:polysaccharide lyase family 7 protein [Vibrio hyugaensis]
MINLHHRFSCIHTVVASLFFLFTSSTLAASAPYDQGKYQPVLDDSKLQAPDSSTLINQGEFEGQHNKYFYVPDSGHSWMTFEVTGDHARSELRQITTWYTSEPSKVNKMIGNTLIMEPQSGSVDEITFMQVHDVKDNGNAINKPLVRLVWLREYQGVENHYWAVIKADACESCNNYDKIDLGEYRDSAVKFEIRLGNNELSIKRDGVTHSDINGYDVTYWGELESHFKAGVYNQTSGTGVVQFESLNYYSESTN